MRQIGNLNRDEFVGEVYKLGLPTHTDLNEMATLLRVPSKGPKVSDARRHDAEGAIVINRRCSATIIVTRPTVSSDTALCFGIPRSPADFLPRIFPRPIVSKSARASSRE